MILAAVIITLHNIGGEMFLSSAGGPPTCGLILNVVVYVSSALLVSSPAAMSSYLFIVKSELPLVIQAFLGQAASSK